MTAHVLVYKGLLLALAFVAGWGAFRLARSGGYGRVAAALLGVLGLQFAVAVWGSTFRWVLPGEGACLNNVAQLNRALSQWALETRRTNGAEVRFEDIATYLRRDGQVAPLPQCPNGGRYAFQRVGQPVVCSCEQVRTDAEGRRWRRSYQRKVLVLDLVWWRYEWDLWPQWRLA